MDLRFVLGVFRCGERWCVLGVGVCVLGGWSVPSFDGGCYSGMVWVIQFCVSPIHLVGFRVRGGLWAGWG